MDAKEYLDQIRTLDLKINQRMMERNDLEWIASRRPGNRDRCMELAASVTDVITDLVNRKDESMGKILQLDDQRYVNVLYLQYVRSMIMEDIAAVLQKKNGMNYTWQHINMLHAKAVKEFSKLM